MLKNRVPSITWYRDYEIRDNTGDRKVPGGLFLDCDAVVTEHPYNADTVDGHTNKTLWGTSVAGYPTLRKYMNGYDLYGNDYTTPNFYENSLNDIERSAVASVSRTSNWEGEAYYYANFAWRGDDIVKEHIFALNAEEATKPEFGYESTG